MAAPAHDSDASRESSVDAVVVGGGPAGLAAALWLARYRRSVLLVDGEQYRSRWTERTHGYLGRDPVPPQHLVAHGRQELLAYPTAAVRRGEVEQARKRDDGQFLVLLADDTLVTRRLVLATGVEDDFPQVDGFFDHYGTDVFHCPSCDGYEARDRCVVVFGWNANLAAFALGLLDWAASVAMVTDGGHLDDQTVDRALLERHGVEVFEGVPAALEGTRGNLRCVRLADDRRLDCDLAFFSIAHRPRTALAEQLGCRLDDEGYVQVDEHGATSVAGVYAAGDVTPGLQLVQIAAAEGTRAGVGAALSLQGEPPAGGAPEPAPDVEAIVNGEAQ